MPEKKNNENPFRFKSESEGISLCVGSLHYCRASFPPDNIGDDSFSAFLCTYGN